MMFNNWLQRPDGDRDSLQAYLPSITLLKVIRSLNPIPLLSFLVLSTSHFFQSMLDLNSFYFHQKEAIFCSMDLQIEIGNLVCGHSCCGRTCATILIGIFLPALDNQLLIPFLQFHIYHY